MTGGVCNDADSMKQHRQIPSTSRRTAPAADGSGSRRPVILEFPGSGNSYSDCFCQALAAEGAIVVEARYSGRWLLRNLIGADYAHFHWPSFHYAASTMPAVLYKAIKFAALLLLMRAFGVRIIWTAHNLYPHERNSPPWIDYAVRRMVVGLSDRVFVHGRTAGGILERELGVDPDRVVSIAHGHFLDHYPMQATREEARLRLGLPLDKGVFAFIGHCRRYKNVTELVAAFQRDFHDSWLVIAGRCPDDAYRSEIEQLVRSKPDRILFEPRFIDDAELQFFIRAADAVVLPFRDVLTSGSAILALSFGRPVVAPRIGNLVEVVNEEMGILYSVEDQNGLVNGMRAGLSRRFDQATIMRHIASLRWQDAAATVLAALRETR
jgi:glycosyltransferase involved in cell wall biosynthesis